MLGGIAVGRDGALVVGDISGHIYGLSPQGTLIWSYAARGTITYMCYSDINLYNVYQYCICIWNYDNNITMMFIRGSEHPGYRGGRHRIYHLI